MSFTCLINLSVKKRANETNITTLLSLLSIPLSYHEVSGRYWAKKTNNKARENTHYPFGIQENWQKEIERTIITKRWQ